MPEKSTDAPDVLIPTPCDSMKSLSSASQVQYSSAKNPSIVMLFMYGRAILFKWNFVEWGMLAQKVFVDLWKTRGDMTTNYL